MGWKCVRVMLLIFSLTLLVSCSSNSNDATTATGDFSGTWTYAGTVGGTVEGQIYLAQTGTTVTGWWTAPGGVGGGCKFNLQCTVTGNTMHGSDTYDTVDSTGNCGVQSHTVDATLSGNSMTFVVTQLDFNVGDTTTAYATR